MNPISNTEYRHIQYILIFLWGREFGIQNVTLTPIEWNEYFPWNSLSLEANHNGKLPRWDQYITVRTGGVCQPARSCCSDSVDVPLSEALRVAVQSPFEFFASHISVYVY